MKNIIAFIIVTIQIIEIIDFFMSGKISFFSKADLKKIQYFSFSFMKVCIYRWSLDTKYRSLSVSKSGETYFTPGFHSTDFKN